MRTVIVALALAGCVVETPTEPEPTAVAEVDAEAVVKTLQLDPEPTSVSATEPALPESETTSEPKKKKKRPLNYKRCQRINKQFIGCGWRCMHGGGGVGGCVNVCGHFLTRKGYKCIHAFGPGFG